MSAEQRATQVLKEQVEQIHIYWGARSQDEA